MLLRDRDRHRVHHADPELDAVVIAASAVAHFALARQALMAGKDVYVEKPLTLRNGLAGAQVQSLVMGNVIQAGNRMNPARQAGLAAGLPVER